MKKIYVIVEECENSDEAVTYGAWTKYENAQKKLKEMIDDLIKDDEYNEDSFVDIENGVAQSDPEYNLGHYTDFHILALDVLDN